MEQVSIVIAESQTLLREGIRRIIELEPDFRVDGTADNSSELCNILEATRPDAVILDVQLQPMSGVDTAQWMKERYPHVKVILFGMDIHEDDLVRGLAAGINGFLLKDIAWTDLSRQLRTSIEGQLLLPDLIACKLSDKLSRLLTEDHNGSKEARTWLEQYRFTEKEYEIAVLIAKGFNNRQIAELLRYSDGTVRNYVSSVYEKIGIRDRAKAVIFLRDSGI